MKGFMIKAIGIGLLLIVAIYFLMPEEWSNKISRTGVSFMEGHYRVTYAVDGHVRQWTFRGKVTSEPGKGYYYFWQQVDGERLYRQVPIARTYIEELPD
jgi:hypothetical protein